MNDHSSYSFNLLASEKPEVNTSIPIGYMDLTTYYSFAGPGNVDFEVSFVGDGGTNFAKL